MSGEPDLAITGLGAMGAALARNLAGTGRDIRVHNRTTARAHELVAAHPDQPFVAADDLEALVADTRRPRAVIIMIASGSPVDDVIERLTELLDPGDVIVDAGNADFRDTERRARQLAPTGLGFLGMGVSGGEEGALRGPSLMPAGDRWAYDLLEPVLHEIAARAPDGTPCCALLGRGGAGHYVKMVHNGIEYADMGAIAEAVELLRRSGRSLDEIADIVDSWCDGDLDSFLLEITARVLRARDDLDERDEHGSGGSDVPHVHLLDRVADRAAQKGTGRRTAQEALELGEPATTIAEASLHRSLSALGDRRGTARAGRATLAPVDVDPDDVADALLASRIVALAQGFDLLAAGARAHGWDPDSGDDGSGDDGSGIDPARVAEIWRAGCIIRSALLDPVARALREEGPHLVASIDIGRRLDATTLGWRRALTAAIAAGVPAPVTSAALAWRDAFAADRLPTALVQAQRDVFGAHTFERTDREGSFHSSWDAP